MKIESTTPEAYSEALRDLENNKIIAFPTETVYGLGANAWDEKAVDDLYAAKGRPATNPLIVHVLGQEQAEQICSLDIYAKKLAKAFWPGPLTIVAPRCFSKPSIALNVTAHLSTIAVRVSEHSVLQTLLQNSKFPIAAPSANLSGRPSATRAEHVYDDFKNSSTRPSIILDGGLTRHGLESTIILCDPAKGKPILLRYGAISQADIEKILKMPIKTLQEEKAGQTQLSPGRGSKHYAPAIPLRLLATGETPEVAEDEAWLGFGSSFPPSKPYKTENLSVSGNIQEAERNLYDALRRLEVSGATAIVVAPLPASAEALRERVSRAATIRPVEAL